VFSCSDIDEDVRSLKEFSTDLVVEATARCLRAIDSSLDLQYRLPPSMAAQFRIGTSLATAVQVINLLPFSMPVQPLFLTVIIYELLV